jgi:hypothetical protein
MMSADSKTGRVPLIELNWTAPREHLSTNFWHVSIKPDVHILTHFDKWRTLRLVISPKVGGKSSIDFSLRSQIVS